MLHNEWSKLVKIVIYGQNCTVCIVKRSTGRLSVDSGRLSVGSGRLSFGSGRLSGWVGKSGRKVG